MNLAKDKTTKSGAASDDKSGATTSGSREESMDEADNDEFGKQSSASSGTTPLSSESPDASRKTGPGGVEGESGNS